MTSFVEMLPEGKGQRDRTFEVEFGGLRCRALFLSGNGDLAVRYPGTSMSPVVEDIGEVAYAAKAQFACSSCGKFVFAFAPGVPITFPYTVAPGWLVYNPKLIESEGEVKPLRVAVRCPACARATQQQAHREFQEAGR